MTQFQPVWSSFGITHSYTHHSASVIIEPPSMEAVVVIEIELVPGGVSVDPPIDMPPAIVMLLLLALLAVELVLIADSPNVDGAPDPVVAVMPRFVVTTGVPSWPLFAVQSRNLFNSALTMVSSDTRDWQYMMT